jgi:putative OPT family oligopeptide transporter
LPEFKPFVPHDSTEREFTLKSVLAGIIMAAIFGAANAYLGMKAGQTVAATIPAAVIAIALFRLPFFRGGVLEQNLTRTAASVGEALVAGAIFTIPAFMMVNVGGQRLWTDLRTHCWRAVCSESFSSSFCAVPCASSRTCLSLKARRARKS